MKPLELVINYEPVAKGRPKFAVRNGASWSYTPTKTQQAQDTIGAYLRDKLLPIPPHISLKLTAIFYRTKSKWLPKREDKPFRKPDLDNFLKLLVDALGQRKYKVRDETIHVTPVLLDDAQITTMNVQKRWSQNGHGYILLRLEEDNDADYRKTEVQGREASQRLRVGKKVLVS